MGAAFSDTAWVHRHHCLYEPDIRQLLHAISCRSEEHSLFDFKQEKLPSNQYLNAAIGVLALQL